MASHDPVIPDLNVLVDSVLRSATYSESHLHGVAHWKCVVWTGLQLAPHVPACDPTLVFLFGLLHDSMRLNDGHDPDHGRRAGAFARRLCGQTFFLDNARLQTLAYACERHADGFTSDQPTVGVCWDADRLNLWRVGACPDPAFLSTEAARDKQRIARAAKLEAQHFGWPEIYAEISQVSGRPLR